MAYADQVRDSKDLDIYILQESCPALVALLENISFRDFFDQHPYDRKWIHRSIRNDTIVDAMWAMANQRSTVNAQWLNGPQIPIDGLVLRLLPPEETLWTKLYVMQRERCDWPDALNMLYVVGPQLDWMRLLESVGEDAVLLAGLITTFRWLCPGRANELPPWLWERLQLTPVSNESAPPFNVARAKLLDSRPWFTPAMDREHRLGEET